MLEYKITTSFDDTFMVVPTYDIALKYFHKYRDNEEEFMRNPCSTVSMTLKCSNDPDDEVTIMKMPVSYDDIPYIEMDDLYHIESDEDYMRTMYDPYYDGYKYLWFKQYDNTEEEIRIYENDKAQLLAFADMLQQKFHTAQSEYERMLASRFFIDVCRDRRLCSELSAMRLVENLYLGKSYKFE